MQKISPNLWFKRNAKEAVDFYLSIFPKGKLISTSYYPTTGLLDFQKEFAGKELAIYFELLGYTFTAINAGDEFSPTPANSFIISFDISVHKNAQEMLIQIWNKLMAGGKALMPLQKYFFSDLYGWVEDKYGYSWQLILTNSKGESRPSIILSLLFTGNKPQAEKALHFYQTVFKNAKIIQLLHYDAASVPEMKDMVMYSEFMIENQLFAAQDGGTTHKFGFSEAVSYNIACKDQAEIDYYWNTLTKDGGEESVCGWCKDKFGVSWQVNPENIEELMLRPGAWDNLLKMKKIDIAKLKM
ncbi:MAG: VOC family protein [Candidatus Pacearchaeota archaeon]